MKKNGEIARVDGYLLTLEETRNFHHKNLQEFPLDDVLLQSKVNLQVVLKLGANLEVKWKQDEVKLFFLLPLLVLAEAMERREKGFCFMNLPLEAC